MQEIATIPDILLAFEQLTASEKKALRDFSKPRLDNTVYTEPDDLIHEALSRCLNGQRHWPKSVPFPLFFCNVMKSIASTERRSSKQNIFMSSDDLGSDELARRGILHPSAEEDYISQQERHDLVKKWEKLQEVLEGDAEAIAVFEAQLEGLSAFEIRERHQLSLATYDISRRRLKRKIVRSRLAQGHEFVSQEPNR